MSTLQQIIHAFTIGCWLVLVVATDPQSPWLLLWVALYVAAVFVTVRRLVELARDGEGAVGSLTDRRGGHRRGGVLSPPGPPTGGRARTREGR